MDAVSVLFVDDEEDIRFSFADRFEEQFTVFTAEDGGRALEVLQSHGDIQVVVTDIRMPRMSGLELIKQSKALMQDVGFIVVSGHAESDDVIAALRLGARNFLRKPYSFEELEESIRTEARHCRAFREERQRREKEIAFDRFMTSIDGVVYTIPNELEWVNHIAFRLTRDMVTIGVCAEEERLNVVLGLIEMITNAIEHGNLGISGEDKARLKGEGESAFLDELRRRAAVPPYSQRKVTVTATIKPERAIFTITDEGEGFNTRSLPDPTISANLFSVSGRGIMLTRTFLDEVRYNEKGNTVTLIKRRNSEPGE